MRNSKIKNQISKFIKNPFFAGSLIMVVGSNLFNFGQLIYHFVSGRLLGRVYYGDLAAIISILGFIFIVQLALGLTVIKFIASGRRKTEVSNFAKWFNWWSLWLGGVLAVAILVLAPFLNDFLNIQQPWAIYVLPPALLFFVLGNTGRSILQGILSFDKYVASLLTDVTVRILLTIAFVMLGYAVFGAMLALLIGSISSFLVARFALSPLLKGKRVRRPAVLPLLAYSFPVLVQGLASTSMFSTDLVLVKHFFSPDQAGIYASAAVLGRAALFASTPIANVMFPMVAKRHSHGQPYHRILYLSALSVTAISAAVVLFFLLFPSLVGLIYGSQFFEGGKLLWWYGVFMGLLGLALLLTQFYLSIGKTRIVWLFVLGAFLQAVLIWFIHPGLLTVIKLSILSAALLVLGLLVYFPYHHPTSSHLAKGDAGLRGASRK